MANASRVAEIFHQASVAFGRLAQLTMDLKQHQAEALESDSRHGFKWSQQEIDQLKNAVSRFGNDLASVAEAIETKTLNQVKHQLKSRALQDAGLADVTLESEKNVSVSKEASEHSNSNDRVRRKHPFGTSEDYEVSAAKRSRLNAYLDIENSMSTKSECEKPAICPTPVSGAAQLIQPIKQAVINKTELTESTTSRLQPLKSPQKVDPVPNQAKLSADSRGTTIKAVEHAITHPLLFQQCSSGQLEMPTLTRGMNVIGTVAERNSAQLTPSKKNTEDLTTESRYEEYEDSDDGDEPAGYSDYDELDEADEDEDAENDVSNDPRIIHPE